MSSLINASKRIEKVKPPGVRQTSLRSIDIKGAALMGRSGGSWRRRRAALTLKLFATNNKKKKNTPGGRGFGKVN